MTVASLELCKELYELSGWEFTGGGLYIPLSWWRDRGRPHESPVERYKLSARQVIAPAYSLGYLLRELPKPEDFDADQTYKLLDCGVPDYLFLGYLGRALNSWVCQYQIDESPIDGLASEADTPEDAACKLAIELFKQGVLTK